MINLNYLSQDFGVRRMKEVVARAIKRYDTLKTAPSHATRLPGGGRKSHLLLKLKVYIMIKIYFFSFRYHFARFRQ